MSHIALSSSSGGTSLGERGEHGAGIRLTIVPRLALSETIMALPADARVSRSKIDHCWYVTADACYFGDLPGFNTPASAFLRDGFI